MSGTSAGLAAYKFAFELCPIFLTGGVAKFVPGSVLPIVVLLEALNAPIDLITGGGNFNLDDFFAHFLPQAGSTLIENDIARYPFANQAVAANALIEKPLHISMRMICPAKDDLGVWIKLGTMLLFRAAIAQHNRSGGLYTVATPSFFYTNCIMSDMRDATGGEGHQVQTEWQLDFERPLLTLEAAQSVQNNLMSKLSNGTQLGDDPSWSGGQSGIGQVTPLSPVPAGAGAAGSSVVTATPLAPLPGAGGATGGGLG